MKGKKSDSEFVSDFITKCVNQGITTPDEITAEAWNRIHEIDEKILEVERLKVQRSKLMDVVFTFERPSKTNKSDEVRALAFFKIQNPLICKVICDKLKNGPCDIEGFGNSYSKEDIMFGLKQLLENKVIGRANNFFLRGEAFDEYLKFALRE